ncbi:hypothetical protein [Truepera radiovictrix]|uniref:Uncharacterized protein n=1 Tax=Truepera radiovictrix (strain DSM 17093 / CIP 108686 / LMG 22925 / RQ-24) TaxID=649638 RepID=D7CYF6_TRURR|nr:hypothetical protein [Truepera radiovictrix]ADI14795.1 hypothetical protein Trad_1677 [Truepera radiovictrix DSM 17093]WMT56654.1 hypothetical protein RCV51_11635 [Truepera radiovictrix]
MKRVGDGDYELSLTWPHRRVAIPNGPVAEASLRPVDNPQTVELRFENPVVRLEEMRAVYPSPNIRVHLHATTPHESAALEELIARYGEHPSPQP